MLYWVKYSFKYLYLCFFSPLKWRVVCWENDLPFSKIIQHCEKTYTLSLKEYIKSSRTARVELWNNRNPVIRYRLLN